MNLPLKEATREILEDWPQDLEADWPSVVAGIELGFGKMDRELTPAPGEPVFPARRLILSGRAEGRECLPRLRRDHAGGCARRGVGTGPLSLRRLLAEPSRRGVSGPRRSAVLSPEELDACWRASFRQKAWAVVAVAELTFLPPRGKHPDFSDGSRTHKFPRH